MMQPMKRTNVYLPKKLNYCVKHMNIIEIKSKFCVLCTLLASELYKLYWISYLMYNVNNNKKWPYII